MSHKNRTHWAATKLRQVEKVEGTRKVAFGSEIDIQWSCHHWNADWFMVQNPYSPACLVIPAYKWVGSHPPTGNNQNKAAQEAPISRLDMTGSLPEMGKFSFWAKKTRSSKQRSQIRAIGVSLKLPTLQTPGWESLRKFPEDALEIQDWEWSFPWIDTVYFWSGWIIFSWESKCTPPPMPPRPGNKASRSYENHQCPSIILE